MDEFKSAMTKCCDIGGLKCSCCNPTHNTKKNNSKSILRKNARAKLKCYIEKSKFDLNNPT